MMRSRSCWNAGRTSSSGSRRRRPLDAALLAACGASVSSSRCSSASRMVDNDVSKEAGAVFQWTDAEERGQRLSQIGKRGAGAEVDAGANRCARDEQRYVFTRVIGARRRRVVAMVGRDDEHVGIPKLLLNRR